MPTQTQIRNKKRIKELNGLIERYETALDAILDLENINGLTDAMRLTIEELRSRISTCQTLLEDYNS